MPNAHKVSAIIGEHDPQTLHQLYEVASLDRVEKVAILPDGHLGYIMPVGGVAALNNAIMIAGVGYDIGCGNKAIRLNRKASEFSLAELTQLADDIFAQLSFGIGRKNGSDNAPVNHSLFGADNWEAIPEKFREELRNKAINQLGTIGSGNHYIDLLEDEQGYLWVGVHFGSRGLGHTIASGFLALAANRGWRERVKEHAGIVGLETPLGQDYWQAMELAGAYAYAGRDWACQKVANIVGEHEITDRVHNHHNFAWREFHADGDFVVVRKGSTPAFNHQRGFVGGSMGDICVILAGSPWTDDGTEDLKQKTMYSAVHGAGRLMSRKQAKKNVTREAMQEALRKDGVNSIGRVLLRGGGLDESPQAYRPLWDVLHHMGDRVEIQHVLKPLIVCMAGPDVFDKYKD